MCSCVRLSWSRIEASPAELRPKRFSRKLKRQLLAEEAHSSEDQVQEDELDGHHDSTCVRALHIKSHQARANELANGTLPRAHQCNGQQGPVAKVDHAGGVVAIPSLTNSGFFLGGGGVRV